MAFFFSRFANAGVHLGVLAGFAVNGELQHFGRRHGGLEVEQIQMTKGVHDLLIDGFYKRTRSFFIPPFARQFGVIAVFDVRHGFARKGGLACQPG